MQTQNPSSKQLKDLINEYIKLNEDKKPLSQRMPRMVYDEIYNFFHEKINSPEDWKYVISELGLNNNFQGLDFDKFKISLLERSNEFNVKRLEGTFEMHYFCANVQSAQKIYLLFK